VHRFLVIRGTFLDFSFKKAGLSKIQSILRHDILQKIGTVSLKRAQMDSLAEWQVIGQNVGSKLV
jgi:hypothetical protein